MRTETRTLDGTDRRTGRPGQGRRSTDSRAIGPRAELIIDRALARADATAELLRYVSPLIHGGAALVDYLTHRLHGALNHAARATAFAYLTSSRFRDGNGPDPRS